MAEDTFARALEGEPVSEAEVKQMWAQSPVMTVSKQTYDEMISSLEGDPQELSRLAGLMREQQPW